MSSPEQITLRGRRHSSDVRANVLPLTSWPGPTSVFFAVPSTDVKGVEAVAAKHWRYQLNKLALELYHGGSAAREVNAQLKKRFGVTLSEGTVWRMYARAVQTDPSTGKICGFWACVPHWRPTRAEPASPNPSHHLSALFAECPKLEARLCTFVHKRSSGPDMRPVSTIRPHMVHQVFLDACKQLTTRQKEGRWPFNEDRLGYEAIRRWHREEKFKHPSTAALNELPQDLAKQISSDYRSARNMAVPSAHVSVAYSETQLDEHYMDQEWTVMVPGSEPGEVLAVHTKRLWALCMVECSSTAVLSSGVAFGKSYTAADVLRLLHSALVPPRRLERLRIQDPEWRYGDDAAYPAELPAFSRNGWMTLAWDRHSTHRAAIADAMEVIRCEVVSGKPASPQARDSIERYFSTLARRAEWFESATGNNPQSPARRNPEAGALASLVYAPLAGEYLDIVCRNYNATPQAALDGNTPLGRLALLAKQDKVFRSPVGEFGTGNLFRLLPRFTARLSRRHSSSHGTPCVHFGYVCYVGPELSRAQHLMFAATTEVDIYVQEDARFAFVVPRAFPEQVYKVVCIGHWRRTPHTYSDRQLASLAARKKVIADAAGAPLTGVGLARGLARAATKSEGLAMLVSGMTAFMDRFGAGAVSYIDMSPEQIDALTAFAEKADKASSEAEAFEVQPWDLPPGAAPGSLPPPANPFGLL